MLLVGDDLSFPTGSFVFDIMARDSAFDHRRSLDESDFNFHDKVTTAQKRKRKIYCFSSHQTICKTDFSLLSLSLHRKPEKNKKKKNEEQPASSRIVSD